MHYKLRNNADSSLWLSFLLPLCLLPLTIKSQLVVDKLAFIVIAWLSVSQTIKEILYAGKISIFNPHYVFHVLLSVPASFGLSWIISFDVVQLYLICLVAVLSYNYIIFKLLISCHGSFTVGEASIIVQGIILFMFYSLNVIMQMHHYHLSATKYSEAVDLLMLLLLGLLLLVCSINFTPAAREGLKFHFICFSFAISAILVWRLFHQQNVFLWLFQFCMLTYKRVYLLSFWLASALASIVFLILTNRRPNSTTSTIHRKYFHIIMNAVYIPGVMYDVQFLCFASGIILGFFIVLEIYRILDVPILGPAIERTFHVFLDEKDSGVLILTHIYLLIGCSCPIWLSSYYVNKNEYHLSLLSGIISVGFGDTFAAIGGTLYGKHTWKGSKKTLEGTACAIIAQLVCSFFFAYYGGHFSLLSISLIILTILFTSLLEAKTDQIDNLILPLFMFSMLSWID